MIRKRLNKIISLAVMATIIGSFVPVANVQASAAISESIELGNRSNVTALSANASEEEIEAVVKAMTPAKVKMDNPQVADSVISEFSLCGTLSYELDDTMAEGIVTILESKMTILIAGVQNVKKNADKLGAAGSSLSAAAGNVEKQLNTMKSMFGTEYESQLVSTIKKEAKSLKVYKYKALETENGYTPKPSAKTVTEGFAVGGIMGLALSPTDTYNALVRNAEYNSSSDLIPVLNLSPVSGGDKFEQPLSVSGSGVKVICDGMNINVLNTSTKKLYVINNPVYNMFKAKASDGTRAGENKQLLNIISFPSTVTNLKADTTEVNLSSMGIKTSILNVSLEPKSSATGIKKYRYVLPIDALEAGLMGEAIGGMGLSSSITNIITTVVKPGTFIMVPDLRTNVGGTVTDTIDDITGAIGDLADAIEDLREDLKDKNDDVNDAWDKVFDRFDNDEGWGHRDGYTYYYDEDGISLKGVQNINGKTYYFNRIDGAMETGWQVVDGKRCYFDKNNGYEVFNKWVQDGDSWYYVGAYGPVVKSDWISSNGTWYYMKADGKMTTGWIKVDDSWYLFKDDGSMVSGTWKWDNNEWYYLKNDGSAASGWNLIDGKWYCFKEHSAALQTGWFRNDGNWYCTDSNGAMLTGWASSSDGWSYLDDTTGKMKKNEWLSYNGNSYYFNVNGIMVTGKRYIDGTKYIFNSNGTLQ